MKDLEQKLSEAQIKEENLVGIINYKNMSQSGRVVRESMRLEDMGEREENRDNGEERGDNEEGSIDEEQFFEGLGVKEVKEMLVGGSSNRSKKENV